MEPASDSPRHGRGGAAELSSEDGSGSVDNRADSLRLRQEWDVIDPQLSASAEPSFQSSEPVSSVSELVTVGGSAPADSVARGHGERAESIALVPQEQAPMPSQHTRQESHVLQGSSSRLGSLAAMGVSLAIIANCLSKNHKRTSEIKNLTAEAHEKGKRIKSLEADAKKSIDSITNLKSMNEELTVDMKRTQKLLKECDAEAHEKGKRIKSLEADAKKSIDSITNLKSMNKELTVDMKRKQKLLKECENKSQRLYDETINLHNENKSIQGKLMKSEALNKNLSEENRVNSAIVKEHAKQRKIDDVHESIKRYHQVDLLFLIDCTGSMQPHIDGVKNQVGGIIDELRERYPYLDMRLSFLGYRDLCDENQFEHLPFTDDIETFRTFVAGVVAVGGGDGPEDIAGALLRAGDKKLHDWQRQVKVLIHVADAPCHGSKYHSLEDDYPDGTPGVELEPQLVRLKALGVDYYFARINHSTDKMVKILQSNEEIKSAQVSIQVVSLADPLQIQKAVVQSVCTSIDFSSKMRVSRDGHNHCEIPLDSGDPEWSLLENRCGSPCRMTAIDVQEHGTLFSAESNFKSGKRYLVTDEMEFVVAPNAFATGQSRLCHWGIYREQGARDWKRLVFKTFKEKRQVQEYMEELRKSCVASLLAERFVQEKSPEIPLRFILPEVLESSDGEHIYNVEPILPRFKQMQKFCDNKGVWIWRGKESDVLADFVEWAYEFTGHFMVVADLQGVICDNEIVLTDPAILCCDLNRFGSTNLGREFLAGTVDGGKRSRARSRL